MAELSDRPFPPGTYPVIVVGSGPGGLQISYCLGRRGVPHAVLSADEAPGGMFRRWPFFQRLLSWTKPFAPVPRTDPAYERYDWNSLLADEPEHRALMPTLMDGSSYFPSRPEMEANLASFAERTGIVARYGCRWTATRREESAEGSTFVLETTDGEYRTGILVLAVGVAEPHVPATPGIELAAHYADTRSVETYADRRVFIVGKQNSGFELASGLLPWARRIILASPSPAKLSVNTRSLVGVRARYLQPFEDHVLAGGVAVLDAAIGSIARLPGGTLEVRVRPTEGGDEIAFEVDEVIAATGFVTPLVDLPALGLTTVGQSRIPVQTPYWESASMPRVFFAGTITQGAPGLRKHGLPPNSGAVHGARYNARVLARHIAGLVAASSGETPTGPGPEAAAVIPAEEIVDRLAVTLATSPELWHQRAYLARVFAIDASAGARDSGTVPLAAFLDGTGDDGSGDAVALTLEADGTGALYPVVYTRRAGRIEEHALEPDILLRYDTPGARRRLEEVVAGFRSPAARKSASSG
ncbi:MAG TPA: NAD(P)-binding domain-containing protein [Candidatus Limnocylindrales bacterium]|nr:NAD(P)-binding domain-containing protein [Candidatus Limnocylindrales bacterium]